MDRLPLAAVFYALLVAHTACAASPPGTLTLVSAAQAGLMVGMGLLNPHAYRPNEFVAQNWVYEGLVHTGAKGDVVPALAESWTVQDKAITFNLRRGVQFHDGEPWNAQAAKANFDNVLAGPLRTGYHGWYDLPKYISGWEVVDEFTFKLLFSQNYYPALQELTIIRPIRFISPKSLPTAPDEKSCPPTANLFWPTNVTEFRCVGITKPAGTGALIFDSKITNQRIITSDTLSSFVLQQGEVIQELRFTRNTAHWDTTVAGNINTYIIKIYPSTEGVQAALLDGSVDMLFGVEAIDPVFFRELHRVDDDQFETYISPPLDTRTVNLNSGRGPTASLAVRKAISHAINKKAFIRNELAGLEQPAYQLFAPDIPYCDVDLSPPIAYDREKALGLLEDAGWRIPPGKTVRERNGTVLELTMLSKSGNSVHESIEDDIRADLASLGISTVAVALPHDTYNQRDANGDWDMVFGETLGTPYDPHSTASYWRTWGGHKAQLSGLSARRITEGITLSAPASNETLYAMIGDVLTTMDESARAALWAKILTVVHEQAVFVPISHLTNVAIVSKRYENFAFGGLQWDLPLHRIVDSQMLGAAAPSQPKLSSGAIAAVTICGVVALVGVVAVAFLVVRERRGRPVFTPFEDMPLQFSGSRSTIKGVDYEQNAVV